jgi:hypothetical protein
LNSVTDGGDGGTGGRGEIWLIAFEDPKAALTTGYATIIG